MTKKQVANILEKRFKGDIHISYDTVKEFIKEEIHPFKFTVLDVSNEFRARIMKTTIQMKEWKLPVEFYVKPI